MSGRVSPTVSIEPPGIPSYILNWNDGSKCLMIYYEPGVVAQPDPQYLIKLLDTLERSK